MQTNIKDTIKRVVGVGLTIVLFILYYITTDPDVDIIKNLSYGIGLILTLNVFFMAMLGIVIIEFFPDFFIDIIYGDEKKLRLKAAEEPDAASKVMIAKSIRMLAYAIVMSAAIIAYRN